MSWAPPKLDVATTGVAGLSNRWIRCHRHRRRGRGTRARRKRAHEPSVSSASVPRRSTREFHRLRERRCAWMLADRYRTARFAASACRSRHPCRRMRRVKPRLIAARRDARARLQTLGAAATSGGRSAKRSWPRSHARSRRRRTKPCGLPHGRATSTIRASSVTARRTWSSAKRSRRDQGRQRHPRAPAATRSMPRSPPRSHSRSSYPTAGNIGGGGFAVVRIGAGQGDRARLPRDRARSRDRRHVSRRGRQAHRRRSLVGSSRVGRPRLRRRPVRAAPEARQEAVEGARRARDRARARRLRGRRAPREVDRANADAKMLLEVPGVRRALGSRRHPARRGRHRQDPASSRTRSSGSAIRAPTGSTRARPPPRSSPR